MNDECRQPLFLDTDQETSPTVFRKPRSNGHCMRLFPWAIIIVLANVLVFQNIYYQWNKTDCVFEPIYPTDFEPMKRYISYHKVRFTSPIYLNANGTFERHLQNHNAPQYVGAPSDELNRNWDALLDGRYFRLTEDEVKSLNEDRKLPSLSAMIKKGESFYFGGIDMLHSLHCLNEIRKHLDPDFTDYTSPFPEIKQLHMDHCIEQLRQSLLCHGDTTPVTLKPILQDTSTPGLLGETERMHTCRNGLLLRNGMTERGLLTGTSY
ncbi:hypothetical protein GGI35DRAFT_367654 [Trichoderma velutinum]